MKSPFPYFGGKSCVADLVWSRFGDCPNYIEPFFGSGAVLLNRPHMPQTETVNDANGFIVNFWRALQSAPYEVASYADWPVSELDLHARHKWLMVEGKAKIECLRDDPEFYDAKVAGWWVWGQCSWIGAGWCSGVSSWGKPFADGELTHPRIPHLSGGHGVNRGSLHGEDVEITKVRQLSRQLPHLSGGRGLNRSSMSLYKYLETVSQRLRRVRICCGDWSRICGPTPTWRHGLTGVFLDPPYSFAEREQVYSVETDCSVSVYQWCLENGGNPLLRIAYCSYGEQPPIPGWERVFWKTAGGYGSQGTGRGRDNAKRETIDFSPHCLSTNLFGGE